MNNTLVNATPIGVKKLDGSQETVEVRQLTIRQLYRFAELASAIAMPEIVALCTGKPPEWIDTLQDDSYGLLAAKSWELNFPRAVKQVATDPLIAARFLPMIQQLQAVEKILPNFGAGLNAPSPVPASSASPAASGSAASI
jgi:hypothetical protein